jgi:beta-glucosidase
MNPFANVKQSLASQVYVVRMSDGVNSQSQKIVYVAGTDTRGQLAQTAALSGGKLAKPALVAAIDSIRVGKNYYTAAKKGIDGYTANVGDITIQSRDIEGEINSLLAGKDKAYKAAQAVQGSQALGAQQYDTKWGTSFWDVNAKVEYQARLDTLKRKMAASVDATGIGLLMGNDAVHGLASAITSTIFPHNIGMGCTNDTELVELACRVVAMECQGLGINWTFAPCIDIVRNERHGRTYEGFDEGPDGTIKYARAAVRGFQGTDLSCPTTIAATAKHFAGAGGTAGGIHKGDCNTASYSELCKIHLPAFKAACDAGVASVMASFNTFMMGDGNLVKMHGNKVLLTDTLKNAWNWKGFVSGDYNEVYEVPPKGEAGIVASYEAGMDNPMCPNNGFVVYNNAMKVTDTRIDDAARRILRIKLLMNLKDDPSTKDFLNKYIVSPEHLAISRECVRRSAVLLKNQNNVLPLKTTQKVHVVGEWANSIKYQCGGWTNGWQGYENYKTDPVGTTIKDAIKKACPASTYSLDATGIPGDADVIVVAVGEQNYSEDAGDRRESNGATLNLLAAHTALINACATKGKPVVCILISGRPMLIESEIEKCQGFIAAWLPGPQADGLADVMFAINGEKFTGKLSHDWPIDMEQIPTNHDNYQDAEGSGGNPLFKYGYGLTY